MGVQAGRGQVTWGHSDKLGFLLRALRSHSRFWALRGSQTRVRDQGGVGEGKPDEGPVQAGETWTKAGATGRETKTHRAFKKQA